MAKSLINWCVLFKNTIVTSNKQKINLKNWEKTKNPQFDTSCHYVDKSGKKMFARL